MTSFPDHPGEHLRCLYCIEHVPVVEAARFDGRYPKDSLHVDCEPEWQKLSLEQKRDHKVHIDRLRLIMADQLTQLGKEDDEYWRELSKEQGNRFVTSTWWRA